MADRLRGTMWMIISAFGMSLMGLTVKVVGTEISTFEKLFFRNLIGIFILFYSIRKKNINILGNSTKGRMFMLLRCTLGLTGAVCYFYSINHLYLADSALLNKLSPFFIALFAPIFLKERFKKSQIPTFILVLVGSLLVIKPQFNFDGIPALAGFLSAIFAGAAYTTLRFLKDYEDPQTTVLWFTIFSTVTMIPPMLAVGFVVPTLYQLTFLLLTGIFATIGQVGLAYAYKYALASEVSIYQYLSIIFSAIFGFLVWGEVPDALSFIGGGLIIASAIINYMLSNREK